MGVAARIDGGWRTLDVLSPLSVDLGEVLLVLGQALLPGRRGRMARRGGLIQSISWPIILVVVLKSSGLVIQTGLGVVHVVVG